MYFPENYDHILVEELGCLVRSAYDQYSCFLKGKPWKIPSGYKLIMSFTYPLYHKYSYDRPDAPALAMLQSSTDMKAPEIPVGFAAIRDDFLFLIFRGTETIEEWARNMEIRLCVDSFSRYGNVHRGFYELYTSFRDQVVAVLSATDNLRLCISGHSLGSALATIAAGDIRANVSASPVRAVYTFASPRVGDGEYSENYNRELADVTFRIFNSSDIVTEVPPPAKLAGFIGAYYSHVDTPVVFNCQKNSTLANHDLSTYMKELAKH